MVDIETLGTADDAVILEIGVVCFDREGRRLGPEWGMVVDHVLQAGRRIDAETLQWWLAPERAASLAEMTRGSETKPLLWHALQEMSAFLGRHLAAGGEMWAKGDFDLRILGHAFKAEGQAVPWKYSQARELRTVMKLAGVESAKDETAHRALDDARAQVGQLWEALSVGRGVSKADVACGWGVYRRQLMETCAMRLPEWEETDVEVRECFAAGVWAAVEAKENIEL